MNRIERDREEWMRDEDGQSNDLIAAWSQYDEKQVSPSSSFSFDLSRLLDGGGRARERKQRVVSRATVILFSSAFQAI